MSLADAKSSKENCAKCFAVPLRCHICNKGFHQKCITCPKASSHDDQWKCKKCTMLQQNCLAESTNCELPRPTNSIPSKPQLLIFQNKLKIYQWNADSIHPKFLELPNLLINSDIDILAVQESKLQKADKTPFIEGYAAVRKD